MTHKLNEILGIGPIETDHRITFKNMVDIEIE